MSEIRESALMELVKLEEHLGFALHEQPVHFSDQWTASIRDVFSSFDVNINNREHARAAHAGAYVMLSTLLGGGSAVPWQTAVGAAYLWRYLSDGESGE